MSTNKPFVVPGSADVKSFVTSQCAEAIKQGIEDGLKGENIMNTTDEPKLDKETRIHAFAIRNVDLIILRDSCYRQLDFLKLALHEYTDRNEIEITQIIVSKMQIVNNALDDIEHQIAEINKEYGDDIRFNARTIFLTALLSKVDRPDDEPEDAEPKPKKTKKPDGNAD